MLRIPENSSSSQTNESIVKLNQIVQVRLKAARRGSEIDKGRLELFHQGCFNNFESTSDAPSSLRQRLEDEEGK